MRQRHTGAMKHSQGRRALSDIRADDILHQLSPRRLGPYIRLARLDRPIGTWLLLFPCLWSIALAELALGQTPDPGLYLLFALGAVVMRAAGCTINDIFDRDFDGRVARTATRPLPSGEISLRQALLFLAGLLAVGLLILVQLSTTAIWLGVASLALVVPYPLMKRITWWPQAWLGLTFNWGALMGWAAVADGLSWPALLLYAGGFFWTLGYDTIYAHQDKEDDALIGVKSSALWLGERTRPWTAIFYVITLLLFTAACWMAGAGWLAYLGLLAAGLHFGWQVKALDIDDPGNCLLRFRSNRFVGWLFLTGIIAANFAT